MSTFAEELNDDALMRGLISRMGNIASGVPETKEPPVSVEVAESTETKEPLAFVSADVTVLPESMYEMRYDDKMKAIGEKLAADGCQTTGKKYYRVLRGKPWTVGYMIDSDPVSTMDELFPGRLFVYEEDQIITYLDQGDHLAIVEIPEMADVSKGFRKISTNMLKVLDVIDLGDYHRWNDMEFCFAVLWRHKECFKYMKNQRFDLCEFAIQASPSNFQYVTDKTPTMYKIFIRACPLRLGEVPAEMIDADLCKIAVRQDGMALEFVPDELKTRELCELAVRTYDDEDENNHICARPADDGEQCFCCSGYNRYFDRTIRGHALKFVPDRFHDAVMYRAAKMLSGMKKTRLIDYDMCMRAVKIDGLELKYVPSRLLTTILISTAVSQNSHALEFVPVNMQTSALCMMALGRSVTALQFIKKPTQKQIAYALKKDPDAWQYITE